MRPSMAEIIDVTGWSTGDIQNKVNEWNVAAIVMDFKGINAVILNPNFKEVSGGEYLCKKDDKDRCLKGFDKEPGIEEYDPR